MVLCNKPTRIKCKVESGHVPLEHNFWHYLRSKLCLLNEQIHVPSTSFALDGEIDYDQLLEGTNSLLDHGNLPAKSMSKFSNAITLLHHGRTKAKDDADEMQVICGGLDAFLDFNKSSSILLSCLSQMSISVIIMIHFGANDRMKNFVFKINLVHTNLGSSEK